VRTASITRSTSSSVIAGSHGSDSGGAGRRGSGLFGQGRPCRWCGRCGRTGVARACAVRGGRRHSIERAGQCYLVRDLAVCTGNRHPAAAARRSRWPGRSWLKQAVNTSARSLRRLPSPAVPAACRGDDGPGLRAHVVRDDHAEDQARREQIATWAEGGPAAPHRSAANRCSVRSAAPWMMMRSVYRLIGLARLGVCHPDRGPHGRPGEASVAETRPGSGHDAQAALEAADQAAPTDQDPPAQAPRRAVHRHPAAHRPAARHRPAWSPCLLVKVYLRDQLTPGGMSAAGQPRVHRVSWGS